ncbi:hypothetical protein D9611_005919 [Ephemerocybe angulata]|uniref:Squalene monooxygenase n=1 Tax=Ephemerocybe angulata TaxID=980116 RepID=A0A8H5CFV4_9AGAR|nr:hypothetical protein D9611_005919 [Tulosesus angulatus]
MSITDSHYDILIVGAGIAGSALAHALSDLPSYRRPLRIALLERSLAEPDRIVGELLQPGGVIALRQLGLEWTLEGIDAVPVKGYCILKDGQQVHIPYTEGHEGRSFHHGKFVMRLREAALKAKGVDVIEATVTELIEDPHDAKRIIGVHAKKPATVEGGEPEKAQYLADLVVIADGCFSNFRTAVMGASGFKPVTRSHFVGAVLEDVTLPIPQHGTVALVRGSGPVLLYQISEHDTRILIDVQQPLPQDLPAHILTNIVPQLPESLHAAVRAAIAKDRLRRMPNSFLPAVEQNGHSCKNGILLLGDAWNMRHPLTGGGMTVALNDVVLLRDQLISMPDFRDAKRVNQALKAWHWARKPLSSTVNILAFALYDLFGAEDDLLEVLRAGCFAYFERGGECVDGPVSLLSGVAKSPSLLFTHFFSVAFYSLYCLFTRPRLVTPPPSSSSSQKSKSTLLQPTSISTSQPTSISTSTLQPTSKPTPPKPTYITPTPLQYPFLALHSLRVFWAAILVFGPLLWSEIRWWSPSDTRRRNRVVAFAVLPVVVLVVVGFVALGAVGMKTGALKAELFPELAVRGVGVGSA